MTAPLKEATPRYALLFWAICLVSLAIWSYLNGPGWDVRIYISGMRSVAAGLDPYATAMALQRAYHALPVHPANVAPPYSYVYSPITLPLLRWMAHLPLWLSGTLYWLLYVVGAAAQIWVALRFVERSEYVLFAYLAPMALFFPGLLENETIQSGNIAFLLYGMVFLAATYGWRKGSWWWFYAAVLVASCVKAPLLSLTLIAPLSARRQMLPSAATLGLGTALFGCQPLVWPVLFRHYLEAVGLQFTFDRDFGCSPAGLYSAFRFAHGLPYAPAAYILFLAYASLIFACLVYFATRFYRGELPLKQWAPLLLVGIILLNPRLMEYDVAPITLPLALIAWRWLTMFTRRSTLAISMAVAAWLVMNAFAIDSWQVRKLMEGPLLVVLFVAGAWTLQRTIAAKGYRETPSKGELALA